MIVIIIVESEICQFKPNETADANWINVISLLVIMDKLKL